MIGNSTAETGVTLGYARVSTTRQSLDRQLDALELGTVPQGRVVDLDLRHVVLFPPNLRHSPTETVGSVTQVRGHASSH